MVFWLLVCFGVLLLLRLGYLVLAEGVAGGEVAVVRGGERQGSQQERHRTKHHSATPATQATAFHCRLNDQ